jgi:hypothetical protein
MKVLLRRVLLALPTLVLLVGVSAGAGTAPAAKTATIKPRTLLVERGLIHAFAQDGPEIAWISSALHHRWTVFVRSVNGRKAEAVGKADEVEYEAPGRVITLPLALAGKRVLWTTFTGGAGWVYTDVATGSPGMKPVAVFEYQVWAPGPREGSPVTGVVGDGATLAYGVVSEICPTITPIPNDCPVLHAGPGGGVVVVADHYNPPAISGIPQPVTLALSQRRVALAPAASMRPNDGYGARPVVNGPVLVYDLTGRLLSSVNPVGTVRQVALAWPTLLVVVERPDGSKALERYNASTSKARLQLSGRIPIAATDLSASSAGAVYRVGRRIYFLGNYELKVRRVQQAKGTPIGLSIEGRRIAWAQNVKGRGQVLALTLP